MQCAIAPVRALPARADVRLRRRPGAQLGVGRCRCWRCGDGDRRPAPDPGRPLAVWKFASCDGCQLTLLDCEDELLAVAERGSDRLLPRSDASDRRRDRTTSRSSRARSRPPHDVERIQEIRAASRRLVTIGACATAGGIQALRNSADIDEYLAHRLRHPPLHLDAGHLDADPRPRPRRLRAARLPDRRRQLLDVIAAFLGERRPNVSGHSVCVECKLRGNVCVMVADGTPCLGPVTHAGCGALCPTYDRGCYGCFGPAEDPNPAVDDRRSSDRLGVDDVDRRAPAAHVQRGGAAVPRRERRVWRSRAERRRDRTGRRVADAPGRRPGPRRGRGGHGRRDPRRRAARHVQLRIYEPPRFFEAFLRGRAYTEPPDITARICGICPVAYQMSACNAIESLCGVTVDGPLADLRRLLYCGEWIESHTLHIYLLHAPDFLGYESVIDLAADHRDVVQRGLELKKIGNELVELVGGRAIHPVNVRVGGFYRVPTERELAPVRAPARAGPRPRARHRPLGGGLRLPRPRRPGELVALRPSRRVPDHTGPARLDARPRHRPRRVRAHVVEEHVAHSTALHARLVERGEYLVGPLARFALNADELSPVGQGRRGGGGAVRQRAQPVPIDRRARRRGAATPATRRSAIIDRYVEPDAPAVEVEPAPGSATAGPRRRAGCCGTATSSTRDGTILDARIVPPTSQNQASDRARPVPLRRAPPRPRRTSELGRRAEQVIRNYDPCISCATHFLDLTVDRT